MKKKEEVPLFDLSTNTLEQKNLVWLNDCKYHAVKSDVDFNAMVDVLMMADLISVDTETTGLSFIQDRVVGASFSVKPNEAWYVPLRHDHGWNMDKVKFENSMRPILERKKIIGWNIKFDWHMMCYSHNIDFNIFADPMIAVAIMDSNKKENGLKEVAFRALGIECILLEDFLPKKTMFNTVTVDHDIAVKYACQDADLALRLHLKYAEQSRALQPFVYDLEMSVIKPLGRQEREGVEIDQDELRSYSVRLEVSIKNLLVDIFKDLGKELNAESEDILNSPKQLGAILFTEMRLAPIKTTKKGGSFSTDKSVLLELGRTVPVCKKIVKYKEMVKIKSSFVDALLSRVSVDGKLRTSYAQCWAVTGRLSSSQMDKAKGEGTNLQNIAKKEVEEEEGIDEEDAMSIRKVFVPGKGMKWLRIDASQIEYRLMASFAAEKTLLDGFAKGLDYHTLTASLMYGVPVESVSKDLRNKGKQLNFGIGYGMSPFTLAKRLGISDEEGQRLYDSYFSRAPGLRRFFEERKAFARKNGFVKTYFGRVRYLPEVYSKVPKLRSFGERSAINNTIQGTAADIQKMVIVSVDRFIREHPEWGIHARLNVHDEIDFSIPENTDVIALCKDLRAAITPNMGNFCNIKFDFEVGDSWGSLEKVSVPDGDKIELTPVSFETAPVPVVELMKEEPKKMDVALLSKEVKKFPCVELRIGNIDDLQAKALKMLCEASNGVYTFYIKTGGDSTLFETAYKIDPNKRFSDYVMKIFKHQQPELQIYSGDALREAQKVSVGGLIFS